ncbi:efflux RND transporter permease subunit [Mucilaginibacter gotjawali]|uniref:Multidrug efflux pump subunit AcrB n=2 Tax=Mucilaginibacter gotjawali TaxID=1550579 RepID=A0A839SC46_9SPHI|nr:efflux RND transporter permease subunit [Mucilaginibacter gotjawali]MBB3055771.1 multidrug efflux pump subunit AcrB [Mucilaginibacter gotjawali]BAU54592.1 Multidrug resistance protein MdtC [Mucilaginibacter gotjawali]
MSMVTSALKRPITVIVITMSLLIFAVLSAINIPIDIFPKLNLPTIYVIESYGGMSARQMEGFFATGLQNQFLYVDGVKNITSKSIQGLTIIKISFYETTNMAEASAQVALQVNRAQSFFPPGALPPQVVRYDASSLPVGELVMDSKNESLKDIYDLAATRIRPMFSTIPGLSAPPPFGSNARTIVFNIDPNKLRSFSLTPDEVVEALSKYNVMSPSGNLRIGNTMYLTTMNSLVNKAANFGEIPVITKNGVPVYIKDIARVSDGADITVDYALINGKRSVYIPIVKTASASTWTVVQDLKSRLPEMQSLLPNDVKISYEFDQSVFVVNAVKSLMTEGGLGALLTGLMVLLFLRDLRSSLIVVITIPVSILIGVLLLSLFGQTINIMTLSGLALAIGILVDQATVTIENIHQHLEMGKNKKLAIYDACEEISFPLLLILLCILAVFAPSFMMNGVPKAMFLPLSMAIGLTMIVSYVLAQTLVPILSNWMIKAERYQVYHHDRVHAHAGEALNRNEEIQVNRHRDEELAHPEQNDFFEKVKSRFIGVLTRLMPRKKLIVPIYLVVVIVMAGVGFVVIGKDMMPKLNNGQFQIRLKEPQGTRLERTEDKFKQVLQIINQTVNNHVKITSGYIGLVPSSFGSSNLYVFNTGTHEAVLQVNLDEDYKINLDELKDALRRNIKQAIPEMSITFEPIDMTEKIMSQGANTPIEVQVAGKNMQQIKAYAGKVLTRLKQIPYLRDVQINQPLDYPVIAITLDRLKISQLGLNVSDIARSVTAGTSSSRFTLKNLWLDTANSYTYQVQAQIPEYVMNSMDELKEIPLVKGQSSPTLADVATFKQSTAPGEYDRTGPRRFITVSANIYKTDLGTATTAVQKAVKSVGEPPKGLIATLGGMSDLLTETLSSLQNGLMFAVLVIFLLLAANYQSFKVSLSVLSTIPAVILGSIIALLVTGSTLNLQSYMGMIMSTGVSVANAILIVTNAEKLRLEYRNATKASITSASIRLRPILMTSFAMIAGMIPMASGMGEAGEQSAPLGRAVIGGLAASTLAALFILPMVFAWVQGKTTFDEPSLMPAESTELLHLNIKENEI